LTEHQDISNLATKDEIPVLDEYAKTKDVQEAIDNAIDEHLNSYGVTAKVTYLSESE
jgi:DNA gyrase/topoisomerase IV subunit B